MPRRKKTRVKGQKRRSHGVYLLEEKHAQTSEDVLAGTINRLRNLGNQRFALSPFSQYFGRWLGSLRDAVSELEANPTIGVDDQFSKERSRILSSVELELQERRLEEASLEKITKNLSGKQILSERIEEAYDAKAREIEKREADETKRLSTDVEGIREELDRIARMKAGIFRRVSEKTRAQKEAEATQRLNSAQRELASAEQGFSAEKERLREEYEKQKRTVTEQVQDLRKEVENLEVDRSLEARRAACEALVDAVNALVQRNGSSLHQTC